MILFRCNASSVIGFGHLVRCRALAQSLRALGERCVLFGPAQAYATPHDERVFDDWIEVLPWAGEADAQRLVDFAGSNRSPFIVLDDYRVDAAYQHVVRQGAVRWLQFDQAVGKPLWSNLVLNANPGVGPSDYAAVIRNPSAVLLLGPQYAILREEFSSSRLSPPERPVEQVLVTFGGGDDRGAIQFVLSTLLPQTPVTLRFLVVSGAHNPRNQELLAWIGAHGEDRVAICVGPENVAPLFASCDVAIIAGGTTTFEAANCGLPMILITIAQNQLRQARAWAGMGCATYLGSLDDVSRGALRKALDDLLASDEARYAQAMRTRRCVDGDGAVRVAGEIIRMARS